MDRIICSSPHIPQQWIAAHCMEPYLLNPSADCVHECVARVEGLCTYARAWVSNALAYKNAAGIVLALTCDQMRRAFEILCEQSRVPCFLFNIPATWQTVQARRFYKEELRRLGRFLVDLGGHGPSSDILVQRILQDEQGVVRHKIQENSRKIPLALAGPHAMAEDAVWLDMISRADAEILVDCSSPSHPVFDRRALMRDPFDELSDSYFNAIQDIFQRPNSGFYQKLHRALHYKKVQGLIVRRYLWCDLWHAEIYRIKQWAKVPVLDLEIGDRPVEDRHRLDVRIQSFMEMLQ